LDALYVKVRQHGRIVNMALVIAIGVRSSGERAILGVELGASEEAPFWTSFLRGLMQRGSPGCYAPHLPSSDGSLPSCA
jgi:putative transposase